MSHPRRIRSAGFTLAEVLVAVAIFAIAVLAILGLVNQNLQLARMIVQQRPDLGALADRTLTEPTEGAGGMLRVQFGDAPMDMDFGGNEGGGAGALYRDANWWRDIEPLDETNGLYRVTIHVEETIAGEPQEIILRYLMFRPDLAEDDAGGTQTQ